MSADDVIEFKNVSVTYQHRQVLDSIDFSMENGDFTYLIGQTGAGKSSFLRLIYRDLLPDEGDVWVAGYHINTMKSNQVPHLRRRLGIVFQDFELLPDRNVYENVAFSLKVTGQKNRYIKKRVIEVLGLVGLSHKHKSMPLDLSGGEKQRVVIARALANEPRIMLADEPTGNLDPEASHSLMKLLEQINDRGMSILMVTHDYELVRSHAHKTLKLEDGQLNSISKKSLSS